MNQFPKIKPDFRRNQGKDYSLLGDWLGCDDAKNLSILYSEMSNSTKRINIYNSGKKHCPNLYTKTYKKLGLKNWEDVKENKLPELYKTEGKTRKELIEDYTTYLGDWTIKGHDKPPIFLDKTKPGKFNNEAYTTPDIAGRFKYMNTNDEVLTNPDEAWLGKDKTRISYLKNCSKNIMLLVEVKDGYYEYFNIIIKRGTSSVNKKKEQVSY